MFVVAVVAVIGTAIWAGCAAFARRNPAPTVPGRSAFWPVVVLLLAGGLVSAASVGLPFLLIGVLLAMLSPLRHSGVRLGPVAAGLTVGVVTAVLIVPAQCSSTSDEPGVVECSSIAPFGFTTDGDDWRVDVASLLIAAVVGVVSSFVSHRVTTRRGTQLAVVG